MKFKNVSVLFLLCYCIGTLHAQTPTSHLAPNVMQLLHECKLAGTSQTPGIKSGNPQPVLNMLMKVTDELDEQRLKTAGAVVGTKAGDIWTVRVPRERLKEVTELTGIEYLEVGKRVALQMDSARYLTHVDSVMKGIGLALPLSGKGVVVGVIDGGFDYTHPAFYDTTYSKLRLKRAWVQGITGTPPTGYTYGAEFKDTTALLQKASDYNAGGSHGNSCAGIAAGSGIGSKNKTGRGIAYEADLVFVSSPLTYLDWREVNITSIIDGINYIFQYAQSQGKPAVVNISLGSIVGAKDGRSLFSQALDNLSGPGKIVCMSAMNNGNTQNHIGKTFTPTDTVLHTLVPIEVYNYGDKRNYIDAWGDSAKTFCLQFGMYKNDSVINRTTVYCMDNTTKDLFLIGSDNDTCYITLTTKTQEYNKKPHATMDILSKSGDTLCLTVLSTDGSVHMWQEYFDETWVTIWGDFLGNGTWATAGDDAYTIGETSCSRQVITVASYVSRVYWKNIQNQTLYSPGHHPQGGIAYYSSKGPTLDNRMKPDIAAPGGMIHSPTNSYDPASKPGGSGAPFLVSSYTSPKNSRTYYYETGTGTSFASPMVAGVVALMLQVNPNLNPLRAKDLMYQTALKDAYTTPTPNPDSWGAGKINAYALLKETIRTLGTADIPISETAIQVYPNPGNGAYTLSYESEQAGLFLVEISNALGERIHSEAWELVSGMNHQTLDLKNNPRGMYFVHITGKGGHVVKKVMIN